MAERALSGNEPTLLLRRSVPAATLSFQLREKCSTKKFFDGLGEVVRGHARVKRLARERVVHAEHEVRVPGPRAQVGVLARGLAREARPVAHERVREHRGLGVDRVAAVALAARALGDALVPAVVHEAREAHGQRRGLGVERRDLPEHAGLERLEPGAQARVGRVRPRAVLVHARPAPAHVAVERREPRRRVRARRAARGEARAERAHRRAAVERRGRRRVLDALDAQHVEHFVLGAVGHAQVEHRARKAEHVHVLHAWK